MKVLLILIPLIFFCQVSEQTATSKSDRQNEILQICRSTQSCDCDVTHYKMEIKELDGASIIWSQFNIRCLQFKHLQSFATKRGLIMTYDGGIGDLPTSTIKANKLPYEIKEKVEEMIQAKQNGKSYVEKSNKAFEMFRIIIKASVVKTVATDCKSTSEMQCFANTGENVLKHATRLAIQGRLKTEFIGTNTSPFLQLFPELTYLKIKVRNRKKLDIYMVDFPKLQELRIYTTGLAKLHCAFDGNTCLSNPEGLKRLQIFGGS